MHHDVIGEYRLLESHRTGRSTDIYKAVAPDGQIVALKVFTRPHDGVTPRLQRFYREAKLAMQVRHCSLVESYAVGEFDGIHYYAMEWLEGTNLAAKVRRDGPLSEDDAVRIIVAVADALEALHRASIIHRDVTPSNVLMLRNGHVKLTDLGLAKELDGDLQVTQADQGLGTAQYIAPEQFERAADCGVRADIYGLGATLYTLLTGQIPFDAPTVIEALRKKMAGPVDVPRSVGFAWRPGTLEAIRCSTEADPSRRPQDVAEFIRILTGRGQVVGRYKLLDQLGRGSTGAVFRARSRDGRIVALKLLDSRFASNRRRLLRFYAEAKLAMTLSHLNLIQPFEVGVADGQHFIAMEYVPGRNLASMMKGNKRFSEAQALQMIVQVALGVDALHRSGVVHRDINPSNIVLGQDGVIRLVDLGLGKQVDNDFDLTLPGERLGTPPYVAPEQFSSARDVDARADVYALGATLYELVTARAPFAGLSLSRQFAAKMKSQFIAPKRYSPTLSSMSAALIRQALAADPAARPRSAREFAKAAVACLKLLDTSGSASEREPHDRWFVRSTATDGSARQLSTRRIRTLVAGGQLGPHARVARRQAGPFVALRYVPLLGRSAQHHNRKASLHTTPLNASTEAVVDASSSRPADRRSVARNRRRRRSPASGTDNVTSATRAADRWSQRGRRCSPTLLWAAPTIAVLLWMLVS